MKTTGECIEILSGREPFKKLKAKSLREIADKFQPFELLTGEGLLPYKEPGRDVGLIASGTVHVYLCSKNHPIIRFEDLGKGDFIGATSLLPEENSSICAFCASPARVYFQKKEDFLEALGEHSILEDYFFKLALHQMEAAIRAVSKADFLAGQDKSEDFQEKDIPNNVRKAVLFIEKNYMSDITLDKLAFVNGMSKFHFCRVFKDYAGCTFKEYLNLKRVKMAKHLMKTKGLNVSEAAFSVGYNDLAYFSRVFKKLEGMNPSRYRKII